MSRRPRRLVAAAVTLPATGCSWLPAPATREAEELAGLWQPFTLVAAAVAALIVGLLVVVLLRYRRSDPDEMPTQTAYNIPVEVVYLVVPVLLLGWLATTALQTQAGVLEVDAEPDVVVEVVAYRWGWQFDYLGDDVVVNGAEDEVELVLPAPAVVEFRGTSRDVVHSFWVPDWLFKRDLVPGRTTTFQVQTVEPGEHIGECAEFCGLDHARMGFTVRTVTTGEFDDWLDEAAADGGTP